jgi:hypothetical protein
MRSLGVLGLAQLAVVVDSSAACSGGVVGFWQTSSGCSGCTGLQRLHCSPCPGVLLLYSGLLVYYTISLYLSGRVSMLHPIV